ncbi:MAG: GNAT family N-acetyltransferase [Nevskia sp.]|nr:GNAT family N-acetyltransferase [Nevskia sp.]
MTTSERLRAAGVTIHDRFEPGDLGELIRQHGVQNWRDYGFNTVHEAYCARIAADFVLNPAPGRSRLWLAKRAGAVVGSVFICECPGNAAQLRLLFVDAPARGLGLGRWLVEQAVDYCRQAQFARVFLWTVEGLERAGAIYASLGFVLTEDKPNQDWREQARELRYDLEL